MTGPRRVFLISLGCAKNRVDSEHIIGDLERSGYEPTDRIQEAHVVVVNTCGFIREAVEESVETILDAVSLKERGEFEKLVVCGCLVQRYGYKLMREIPEVDGWLGTGELHRVPEVLTNRKDAGRIPFYIGRPVSLPDHSEPRVQTMPAGTAYLRIAEGCSHGCTYCLIPQLRGPYRSRRLSSLIREAEGLVSRGVKEINLIAQDITRYGTDLGDVRLEDLLERLAGVKGLRWIRLLYGHPGGISDRLLDMVRSCENICSYLDLPLQHADPEILKAMGRDPESPCHLVERIRNRMPDITLRTTVMVGFPGETPRHFEALHEFVKTAEFDHLGVFVFSREKGTRACRLGRKVPEAVARERLDRLMTLQSRIARKKKEQLLQTVLPVLVEGVSPETPFLLEGRTAGMAPEVDGRVFINKGAAEPGEIVSVKIQEAYSYDLIGEIADDPAGIGGELTWPHARGGLSA